MKNQLLILLALTGFIVIVFSGCKEETKGFNCESGNCVETTGDTEYTTLTECQSDCRGGGGSCGSLTTVTDIDGNIYNVVTIGNQCWMKENLKTTRNNDGSAIPTGLTDNAWSTTTAGAYAIYANDAANNTTYGKLYNWYAVTDTRNVCPTGWRAPTDADFTELTDYLGGEDVAGGKMKSLTLWLGSLTVSSNSSDFTALPAGYRSNDGSFYGTGSYGMFWSSRESSASNAWYRVLYYSNLDIGRPDHNKQSGYSVRCVKD